MKKVLVFCSLITLALVPLVIACDRDDPGCYDGYLSPGSMKVFLNLACQWQKPCDLATIFQLRCYNTVLNYVQLESARLQRLACAGSVYGDFRRARTPRPLDPPRVVLRLLRNALNQELIQAGVMR
ncbi:hypothetical protein ACFL2Q_19410 [Thermodesulfobacteriota bacterium]